MYSEFAWSEEYRKKAEADPEKYMQAIQLIPGTPFVDAVGEEGHPDAWPLAAELVEEYRYAPGHVMSLRGYVKAAVCDNEPLYGVPNHDPQGGKGGASMVQRRWRDAFTEFPHTPFSEEKRPFTACSLLVALYDTGGMGQELASLQKVSCATILHYVNWHGYGMVLNGRAATQRPRPA